MSFNVHPEELENTELKAIAIFAPFLLKEALQRLCHSQSASCLDEFERAMVDRIDEMESEQPNFAAMKELAISNLYVMLKSVRDHPDTKQPMEDLMRHRTQGRSEQTETLEEQLPQRDELGGPGED